MAPWIWLCSLALPSSTSRGAQGFALAHIGADRQQGPFEQRLTLLRAHQTQAAHDRDASVDEGRQFVGEQRPFAHVGSALQQPADVGVQQAFEALAGRR